MWTPCRLADGALVQVCKNVQTQLVGQTLGTFTRVASSFKVLVHLVAVLGTGALGCCAWSLCIQLLVSL